MTEINSIFSERGHVRISIGHYVEQIVVSNSDSHK